MKLDEELKSKDYAYDAGATSNVVLITDKQIFCANAGDSRAVLG
jgi:serine/threonine protein phosphatase PrpC